MAQFVHLSRCALKGMIKHNIKENMQKWCTTPSKYINMSVLECLFIDEKKQQNVLTFAIDHLCEDIAYFSHEQLSYDDFTNFVRKAILAGLDVVYLNSVEHEERSYSTDASVKNITRDRYFGICALFGVQTVIDDICCDIWCSFTY